ncbi:hypothetical protein Tco_0027887, partial [Tanacetum coccineum]
SKDLSKSDNPTSLDDNKFNFVYEASRRSNVVCLQLFTKELEASPGQSAASSIISRNLNDPGSYTDNSQVRIMQITQENGQSRTNTDTGKERVYKIRGFDSKKGQKSTPVNP